MPTPNRLSKASSPYLRQHAHNPVDWFPWGEEALQKARSESKLIFLSIGYSSCHWCHVMERECFENEEIAAFLNQHFVSIKVDREERPDLDGVYMEAVQWMSGTGGWPLSIWLTPNLIPIYGGTYFPPFSSPNRPGFLVVLQQLFQVFTQEPDKVTQQSQAVLDAMSRDLFDVSNDVKIVDNSLSLAGLVQNIADHFEPKKGGFSSAPKFPMGMSLDLLFHIATLEANEKAQFMAEFTLQNMLKGGIYDHVGGGIARYSTDGDWLVPHFEKMLYDNALLLRNLALAQQAKPNDWFREVAEHTLSFLNREMCSSDGLFFTALDADSEGEEGLFYRWTFDELHACFDPKEWEDFTAIFEVEPDGNWEGNIVLCLRDFPSVLANKLHLSEDQFWKKTQAFRAVLLEKRSKKVRPLCDEKHILGWNALLLQSFCECAWTFKNPDWLNQAQLLADALLKHFRNHGDWFRIRMNGQVHTTAFLDDLALLGDALLQMFQLTAQDRFYDEANSIRESIETYFSEDKPGRYRFSRLDIDILPGKRRDIFDNAFPSAHSALIQFYARFHRLSGFSKDRSLFEAAVAPIRSFAMDNPLSFSFALSGMVLGEFVGREIVAMGGEALKSRHQIHQKAKPSDLLICGNNSASTSPILKGKLGDEEKTLVWVCEHFTCDKPLELNHFLAG